MDSNNLKEMATQVRRDIVRMVHKVQSGHPGGSLGCADFITALYFKIMERKAGFDMDGIGEDIFFLSNGHISPVFYSVLARSGYFPISELSTFRHINSRLQGHPATHEHLPGVRIASGSLGQGMSVACGAALAKKMNKDAHIIYTLHGDGELQEGNSWEAILLAGKYKLHNLVAVVDYNNIQIEGYIENVMPLAPLAEKWRSFNWNVIEIDGHNFRAIDEAFEQAKEVFEKPTVILARTIPGKGVGFMEHDFHWHGMPPNAEQAKKALEELRTLGGKIKSEHQ